MIKLNKAGYCNPPKEAQFKKGQSGNPKGRPRNLLKNNKIISNHFDITNKLFKELNSKLVMANGTKIPKIELLIKQLTNNAISAKNTKDQKQFIDLLHKLENKNIYESFINKLIQENYITEENLREFASYNKSLNTENMEKIVNSTVVNRYVKRKHAIDLICGVNISIIESIPNILAHMSNIIIIKIIEECSYRDAVYNVLDIQNLSQKKRQEILDKIDQERNLSEPPINVLKSAYLFIFYSNRIQLLRVLRNEEKAKEDKSYQEAYDLYNDEDGAKDVLKRAKKELTQEEYDSLRKIHGTEEDRKENEETLNTFLTAIHCITGNDDKVEELESLLEKRIDLEGYGYTSDKEILNKSKKGKESKKSKENISSKNCTLNEIGISSDVNDKIKSCLEEEFLV